MRKPLQIETASRRCEEWMRRFIALLLLASVASPLPDRPDTPLPLREIRAWRGTIEVEARSADGGETQAESAVFVVETSPRRTAGARHRLKLRLRRATGTWNISIDNKRAKGRRAFVQQGSGSGALRLDVTGELDMLSGAVVLRPRVQSPRFVAKTTLSGTGTGGFGTYRSVASRRSCIGRDWERGTLDAERRRASGEREFKDIVGGVARKVTVRWKLERIDPEVRGRVVDHAGKPVAGLKVVARTIRVAGNRPGTYLEALEAETDEDGRFTMPAKLGTYGVQVNARRDGDLIIGGWLRSDAAILLFDNVPDLRITIDRYRLSRLPQPHLLARNFRGDVDRYLEYVRRRYSKARIAASRIDS